MKKKLIDTRYQFFQLKGTLKVVRITLILLIFEWLILRKVRSGVSWVLDADFVFLIKKRENL